VLSILEKSDKPLSATDICSKMEERRDSAAWLSTVYRVLEIFVEKGVVIKTNMMNNEMACMNSTVSSISIMLSA
jgi:Fur family ferric uptake transcriptional regulator